MYKIYCIWSGNNIMSNNRKKGLLSLIYNSGCHIDLITPDTIKTIEKSQYPIHPAYEYLSLTHKSDYIRAYIMHHYGGGYTDIKYINFNWIPYFRLLDMSNYMFIGYKEITSKHIASDDINIRNNFSMICGCSHFIMKPYSDFTYEWINILSNILDSKLDLLKQNPGHYHPRAVFGGVHQEDNLYKDSKYPLIWNEILGRIVHPLMYKYIGRFQNIMPQPNLYNYR